MLKKGRPNFGHGMTMAMVINATSIIFVKLGCRMIFCKLISGLSNKDCLVWSVYCRK